MTECGVGLLLPISPKLIWTAFGRLESCGSRQALISTQHALAARLYLSNILAAFIPPGRILEDSLHG